MTTIYSDWKWLSVRVLDAPYPAFVTLYTDSSAYVTIVARVV